MLAVDPSDQSLAARWRSRRAGRAVSVVLVVLACSAGVVAAQTPEERFDPTEEVSVPQEGRWGARLTPAPGSVAETLTGAPRPAAAPRKAVAFTFDGGPSENTINILNELARQRLPATFFVSALDAEKSPGSTAAIVSAGHSLGTSGVDGRLFIDSDIQQMRAELDDATMRVNAIAGRGKVRCVRPPEGATRSVDGGLEKGAADAGLGIASFSIDASEAPPDVQATTARGITDDSAPIIRLSDRPGDASGTIAALGALANHYRSEGYDIVRIC